MDKLAVAPINVDPYWQGRRAPDGAECPYLRHSLDARRWHFGCDDRMSSQAQEALKQETRG